MTDYTLSKNSTKQDNYKFSNERNQCKTISDWLTENILLKYTQE